MYVVSTDKAEAIAIANLLIGVPSRQVSATEIDDAVAVDPRIFRSDPFGRPA